MKKEFEELKNAQKEYVLMNEYELTEKVLTYIKQRIVANRNEIEKLQKVKKERYSYERIIDCVEKEIEKDAQYKNYGKMYINNTNFLSTNLLMAIGVIAVECYDTLEVIKYFIKAIKSRNAIAISDVEYDDTSIKFLILEIIKEALNKFGIIKNLIMILPYEECFYNYFDKVIFTYDKNGKFLKELKVQEKITQNKKWIYIENSELEEIAQRDNKNIQYELITGEFESAIEKINAEKSKAVVMYTKNSELAYKFINLVKSENVFINSSLENIKETEKSENVLYEYKNILIPMPEKNLKNKESKNLVNVAEFSKNEEMSLIKVNDGILSKIRHFLKKILG